MPTVSAPAGPRAFRRLRLDSEAIENALVRSSVGALAKGRDTCRHCHRTPLVGEVVHFYARGRRHAEDLVCELCRPLRTAEPDRSALVRSPDRRGSVRPVGPRT